MQRTRVFLTIALAGVASILIVAGAQGAAPTAQTARAAKVGLRHTSLGNILVSASGFTLYEFTRDHGAHNSCLAIRECSSVWPAYTTSGRPSAGPGVRASLLSSIRIAGGKSQVTYAGHPLYLYSADSGPAETSYVNVSMFGGRWYALSASGGSVK